MKHPRTPRPETEAFAEFIRTAVTDWLDDQAPQWVHMELVLDAIGPIFHTTRVLDIVTHMLDEHPDYHRLATGSRPLLVSDGTYAWCVWERDVDEDARTVSPEPVLVANA